MEKDIVESNLIELIGEYGIVKVKEVTIFNDGKILNSKTCYDVCLEHGEGDIVASFDRIKEARKWAKEN